MSRLLYVESSPRKQRSASIKVAHTFLNAYRDSHPAHEIETLDLWDTALPRFDGATIDAKYAVLHKEQQTPEQAEAWREVVRIAEHLKAADKLVFSVPMWNLNVPYVLKHYIDVVTQPGLTFSFSPETGYRGLVTGKRAMVIYSSSGDYTPGSGNPRPDLQKPFFDTWLCFIGITDIQHIVVAPTISKLEVVENAKASALEQARRLALEF